MTSRDRREAAATWLAAAHPEPARVRRAWAQPHGIEVLPCGTLFTAVRVPEPTVRAAAGSDDLSAVHTRLAATLHGPVIRDPGSARYYPLVPAGTSRHWRVPGVECLTSDYYLGVPAPAATAPSGAEPYWAVPIAGPGHLCDPVAVERFVRVGRERVAQGAVRWCSWHHGYAHGTVLIRIVDQGTGPGGGLYGCAGCRERHALEEATERRV